MYAIRTAQGGDITHLATRRLGRGHRLCVAIPGAGFTGLSIASGGGFADTRLMLDAGPMQMLSSDLGSPGGNSSWGNDTAVSELEALRQWALTDSPVPCSDEPIFIRAGSMGMLIALNYARAYPGNVAAIVALQGAVDVEDIYDNDRGGFASSISTAFGGAPPSSKNPAANTGDLEGIPMLLYYGESDAIVVEDTQTDFAAALPDVTLVSQGAVGHGSLTGWDATDAADFLTAAVA